jgi:predicted flap endonuclease-1-like 5' DNA nuclease
MTIEEDLMDATTVGMLVGVVLVIITLLLIFWGNKKDLPAAGVVQPFITETKTTEIPPPAESVVNKFQSPFSIDELTLIEGIEPSISNVLKKQGITTYAELASVDVTALQKVLRDQGLYLANPTTWPAQARLAAEGKMEELKEMQEKIIAGE